MGSTRVLVTGGAGFIGSHLCKKLLDNGCRVYCLDNLSTGAKANLSDIIGREGFLLAEDDVCEPFDFQVDCVVHLASPASPVKYMEMPVETLRANSVGTTNCLELALRHGAKVVLGSTSEIYGDPEVSPQPETYFGNANPVGPRSCYNEAKRFAEALSMSYHRAHGVNVVVLRIFNTYGPRMQAYDGRVIPNFITQALTGREITIYGDGKQTRSFCYVDDMVNGIIKAISSDQAVGQVINLGNLNEITIMDLASRVLKKCRSSSSLAFSPLLPDDPRTRCPDITLARELLDWEPEVPLDQGLEKTIAWFQRQGEKD